MGSKRDTHENAMLDHCLAVSQHTYTASVWIALYTTAPADNSDGVEASGGSYARLEIGGATGRSFTTAASGSSQNNEEWSFTTATGDWGNILGVAVCDAVTSGNIRYWDDITSTAVNNGDTAKIAAGALVITED